LEYSFFRFNFYFLELAAIEARRIEREAAREAARKATEAELAEIERRQVKYIFHNSPSTALTLALRRLERQKERETRLAATASEIESERAATEARRRERQLRAGADVPDSTSRPLTVRLESVPSDLSDRFCRSSLLAAMVCVCPLPLCLMSRSICRFVCCVLVCARKRAISISSSQSQFDQFVNR
jgi:hypothetical protein